MPPYARSTYLDRHRRTAHSANAILSILLERLTGIHSAVDVGCGVGTWLSVLLEKGISDVLGVDGDWVEPDLLVIPKNCFQQIELDKEDVCLPHKYDLAISLEVGEHLPPERAKHFVRSLTELSDCVLFSAAIPFQRGKGHVNEQWPSYWINLFGDFGYTAHDFIRPMIWYDAQIPFWYRQNILVFAAPSKFQKNREAEELTKAKTMPLDMAHPELYLEAANTRVGVRSSAILFGRSLADFLRRSISGRG
jgi:SAM-dependent methyltransferase